MQAPERFSDLPEYAFPRLRALLDGTAPGGDVLAMSIGEPRHPMPDFVRQTLADGLDGFSRYPANNGTPELLEAIAGWIDRRYGVAMDPTRQIMVLNGTREGLFNAALATFPEKKAGKKPVVLIPNPFYQVYAVAALETRADPVYVPATAETGFLPDYRSASTRNPRPDGRGLRLLLASEPAGRGGGRGVLEDASRSRRGARFPGLCR